MSDKPSTESNSNKQLKIKKKYAGKNDMPLSEQIYRYHRGGVW